MSAYDQLYGMWSAQDVAEAQRVAALARLNEATQNASSNDQATRQLRPGQEAAVRGMDAQTAGMVGAENRAQGNNQYALDQLKANDARDWRTNSLKAGNAVMEEQIKSGFMNNNRDNINEVNKAELLARGMNAQTGVDANSIRNKEALARIADSQAARRLQELGLPSETQLVAGVGMGAGGSTPQMGDPMARYKDLMRFKTEQDTAKRVAEPTVQGQIAVETARQQTNTDRARITSNPAELQKHLTQAAMDFDAELKPLIDRVNSDWFGLNNDTKWQVPVKVQQVIANYRAQLDLAGIQGSRADALIKRQMRAASSGLTGRIFGEADVNDMFSLPFDPSAPAQGPGPIGTP